MAKCQTELSEEINEEIVEFTAGEGDRDVQYQLLNESTEFDLNEVKRVLVYVMREIAVLSGLKFRNDSSQNTVKTNEGDGENKEISLVSKFSVDNYLSIQNFRCLYLMRTQSILYGI
jgi:hypothetical protein